MAERIDITGSIRINLVAKDESQVRKVSKILNKYDVVADDKYEVLDSISVDYDTEDLNGEIDDIKSELEDKLDVEVKVYNEEYEGDDEDDYESGKVVGTSTYMKIYAEGT